MFKHVERNFPMITANEQKRLEDSRVAIAGVGGIGAWVAEALVRMGIGHFHIADLDNYEIHNLNRQTFSNQNNLGKEKVHIVANGLKEINDQVEIEVFDQGVTGDNIISFLKDVDIVIDAVEYFEFKARRMIQNESRKLGIPTFLNVVAAFNVGLFIFTPDSMCFDEFMGYDDNLSKEESFTMPFERTIPIFPQYMIEYSDPSLLKKIFSREAPITNLCSPIAIGAFWAANEVILKLLNRREITTVPECLVFDLFANKCHTVNPVENPQWSKEQMIKMVERWD